MTEYQTHAALVATLETEIVRLRAVNAELRKSIQAPVQPDTKLEQAARQALEALEEATSYTSCPSWSPSMTNECNAAITELREALEQPNQEAEPVAAQHRFRRPERGAPDWSVWQPCKVAQRPAWEIDSQGYEVEYRALYAAPQPTRQPLTDEQIDNMVATASLAERDMFRRFARAIERAHGIGGEA